MSSLTWDVLRSAMTAGGPSVLVSTTELAPAGGQQAAVAPARYVSGRQGSDTATYAYEVRFIDGEPRHVVILDSKQSQLNRAESALQQAIWDGIDPLVRIPQVRVTYTRDGVDEVYTDLMLPHRAYDGHVRAGTVDGVPVTQTKAYPGARPCAPWA